MQIHPDVLTELAPVPTLDPARSRRARLDQLRRRLALGLYEVDLDRLARAILDRDDDRVRR